MTSFHVGARGRADRAGHPLRREPEALEQLRGRRRLTEPIDPDHRPLEPDVLAPDIAHAGLDGDARHARREHALAVGLRPADRTRSCRASTRRAPDAVARSARLRLDGELHLRAVARMTARGAPPRRLDEHVAAARPPRARRAAGRQRLPRERTSPSDRPCRSIGGAPGDDGLDRRRRDARRRGSGSVAASRRARSAGASDRPRRAPIESCVKT